jgi:HAMP domain-containing protein
MQLRLRTKLTLVMTGLVLLVVATVSGVYFAQLLQQVLDQNEKSAIDIANNTFQQLKGALNDASSQGWRPESNSSNDLRDYVIFAFGASEGLQAQLQGAITASPIYEISVADLDGIVLASTDKSLVGKYLERRTPIPQLTRRGFLQEVRVLTRAQDKYEYDKPFNNHDEPFGEIRVAVASSLVKAEIVPIVRRLGAIVLLGIVLSTVLAAVVSRAALAPLARISAQLDRISAGQYDSPFPEVTGFAGSPDELGQVSKKISQVGQQLRGVHEIFSSMRENMNSVMAGLEDGLLLFTRDARAVMVSPAAEKFLGASA